MPPLTRTGEWSGFTADQMRAYAASAAAEATTHVAVLEAEVERLEKALRATWEQVDAAVAAVRQPPLLPERVKNDAGETMCIVRYMVETPGGWLGAWDEGAFAAYAAAAVAAVRCPCGDRLASECPGAWEQGCDLGANAKHAQPAPTMDSLYGDGSDHPVCEKCGFCRLCGDCDKHGCGQARTMTVTGAGVDAAERGHWYSPAAVQEMVAAERERCAALFDIHPSIHGGTEDWCREVAATIRKLT
jgi:hypothetical protein